MLEAFASLYTGQASLQCFVTALGLPVPKGTVQTVLCKELVFLTDITCLCGSMVQQPLSTQVRMREL